MDYITSSSSNSNQILGERNESLDDLPMTPRPTFRRYKPNRHIQIPIGDSECDSACLLPQSQDDEMYEEVEGVWSLRGVLNFLMVVGVLVLSTSYISCMNSPISAPVVLDFASLRGGGYHMNTSLLLFEPDGGVVEEERIIIIDAGMEEKARVTAMLENGEEGKREGEEIPDFTNPQVAGTAEENQEGETEIDKFIEASEEDEGIVEEDEEWNEITELLDSEVSLMKLLTVSNQVSEIPSSVAIALEKEDFVHESFKGGIFEAEKIPIGNVTDVYKNWDEGGKRLITSMDTESIIIKVVTGLLSIALLLWSIIAPMTPSGRRHRRNSRKSRKPKEKFIIAADEEEKQPFESATAHLGISGSLIAADEEEKKPFESATAHLGNSSSSWHLGISSLSQHQSQGAPVIELLCELEFPEMSTSHRRCGIKNNRDLELSEMSTSSLRRSCGIKNSREPELSEMSTSLTRSCGIKNSRELELSEMSTSSLRSCSIKKSRVIDPQVSSKPVHVPSPAFWHTSNSYTDERKQSMKKKKREIGNSEGKNVLTTPLTVRRSSRIRNRAFSP
ncbi:uncharacterized protein [Euphorbia lathyris]|uniref:uncharacterized protein n=1 Tax=Euphorbia lathyris TaxID=212925 RepID=UPI0033144795